MQENTLNLQPERLAGEVVEVLLAEVPAARRLPLHVERVARLRPRHLVGHDEGRAAPLREGVVPRHRGQRRRLLVAVHDHHHGEREGPDLEKGVSDT